MKLLNWSEPSPPTVYCGYHHTEAPTPFGRFLLTWKGWKDDDLNSMGFDETPWGDVEYNIPANSIQAAQEWAEAKYTALLQSEMNKLKGTHD